MPASFPPSLKKKSYDILGMYPFIYHKKHHKSRRACLEDSFDVFSLDRPVYRDREIFSLDESLCKIPYLIKRN